MSDPETNSDMKAYWNGVAGEKWVRLDSRLDAGLQHFADAVIEAARVRLRESVLDIGCGCGATTLQAARTVGHEGRAVGVDISSIMLQRARQRADDLGLPQVHFECADAQVDEIGSDEFDATISRFGVMFFVDPRAAFANIAKATRSGGRLAFVCWQRIESNPWMLLPTMAAAQHVAIQRPADPTTPGPFAFADADRVTRILENCGWSDVAFRAYESDMTVGGGGLAQAVDFMMEMGPAAQPLRDADETTRSRVREAIAEVMRPHLRAGEVKMASAAWIFTAVRES
jgi:ubiquinone/menaquinone biosynthesis C-methylase UbiE